MKEAPYIYSTGLYTISEALCAVNPDAQHHGFLGGDYGYGQEFICDVFEMHPYYWGDCTCGYGEKVWEWDSTHNHSEKCYSTKLYKELDKFRETHPKAKFGDDRFIVEALCKEYKLEYPHGCMVHCTCDYQPLWKEWVKHNDHSPRCPTVLPNFIYYPLELEVKWYKYIGRGMETNKVLSNEKLLEVVFDCLKTIKEKKC